MARPAAEEPSENDRRDNRDQEEDRARVDDADLKGLHRFRRFDGGDRHPRDQPLDQMRDHE